MVFLIKVSILLGAGILASLINFFWIPRLSDNSPLYRYISAAVVVVPLTPFLDSFFYSYMTIFDGIKSTIGSIIVFLVIWALCTGLVILNNDCNSTWTNYRSFREMTIQDDAQFEYRGLPILHGKSHKCICILNPVAWYDYMFDKLFKSFRYTSNEEG